MILLSMPVTLEALRVYNPMSEVFLSNAATSSRLFSLCYHHLVCAAIAQSFNFYNECDKRQLTCPLIIAIMNLEPRTQRWMFTSLTYLPLYE